jgi:peptidoglycan hydrolase-like amidase
MINFQRGVINLIIIFILSSPLALPKVHARTTSEINNDIENQKKSLQQSNSDLQKAKNNVASYSNALASASSGLPALEAEIAKLKAEIEYNEIELKILNENRVLKELEMDQRELEREGSLKSTYMEWRVKDTDLKTIVNTSFDIKKSREYGQIVMNSQQKNIFALTEDLDSLNADIQKFETAKAELDKKNVELQDKKKKLEEEIARYQYLIQFSGNQVNTLQSNITAIQGKISGLSEEQRQAFLREEEILRQNQGTLGNTSCTKDPNAPAGSIYLCGNGRDLVMGHGVGMSQYGAKGAADQGRGAADILTFYYPGASVGQYPLSSEISVKYCPGNPALDAYQDGCSGGAAPVTERVSFDTYLSGLGEMPDSWPVEARKAQMIAARTYAARYTANGNSSNPICLTTYCQVSYFKNGDTSEASVVQQTKDLVITYGGQLIEALYSADNNQGGGSADIDTRFQQVNGDPTGGNSLAQKPYLKSVNDNQFALNSRMYWSAYCQGDPCGLWKWKSYSYSYSDLNTLLDYSGLGSWRAEMNGVASISFIRDPSLRVKKVIFTGNNGVQKTMGGWWFKNYWNIWAESKRTYDYIYSQTYYLNAN